MSRHVRSTGAYVYVSVDRPWLGEIPAMEVFCCETCNGAGSRDNRTCPTCRHYGRLHGYDSNGRGLPVESVTQAVARAG